MIDNITGYGANASFAGNRYVELAGLSTDSKPTEGILTGSIFVEVDTGKVFLFNRAAGTWVEQFSFQS